MRGKGPEGLHFSAAFLLDDSTCPRRARLSPQCFPITLTLDRRVTSGEAECPSSPPPGPLEPGGPENKRGVTSSVVPTATGQDPRVCPSPAPHRAEAPTQVSRRFRPGGTGTTACQLEEIAGAWTSPGSGKQTRKNLPVTLSLLERPAWRGGDTRGPALEAAPGKA